ncbi:MAG: FliG C-terminal domain-containing protein [Candidatus Margulisbacteria bacterium]|nr:FliG C-terminal domain-containing protein [Candidatus Margulisiibacteriota bacterium]
MCKKTLLAKFSRRVMLILLLLFSSVSICEENPDINFNKEFPVSNIVKTNTEEILSMNTEKNTQMEFNSSSEILSYQQIKEKDLQNLLDKIFGINQVIVAIKVRVKVNNQNAQRVQTLFLPGVPIKQIAKSNIQNVYIFSHYEVTVWLNSSIKNEDEVLKKIKSWLDFDLYRNSTIQLYKENFYQPEKNDTSKADAKFLDSIKEILKNNADMNTVLMNDSDKKFQLLIENSMRQAEASSVENNQNIEFFKNEIKSSKEFISTLVNKKSSSANKLELKELIFIGLGILLILTIAGVALAMFMLAKSASGIATTVAESSAKESSSGGGGGYGGGGGSGMSSQIANSSINVDAATKGFDDEITIKQDAGTRDYFEFVNEGNILKLAYLLERDKPPADDPNKDLFWQKVAIIISYLPSHLGSVIFSRFDTEEQTDIIPFLTYEIEYPAKDIEELEKTYKEKVACLIGGKHAVLPLLDKFPTEKKTELTMALHEKHPDVLAEIRDMIVLFEDVLSLNKEDLTKVFMELDPNLLAMCLISFPEDERNTMISGLAPGLQAMVKEVISLRKDNFTEVELANAKDYLIKTAKALNKMGRISIKQKEFGVDNAKMNQDEIDALFKNM